MSEIYTDPPQSRNEAIIRATIDGTEYTAPPQSRMEDLLLELKEVIEQGGGGGTKDYEALDNKPSINDVELSGNKTSSDLGLMPEYEVDNAPTEDSENLISSKAVWEADKEIKDRLQGSKTVTGNPLEISDYGMTESLVVDFEPTQDLHGYDKPWAGGAGHQLYDYTASTNGYRIDSAGNPYNDIDYFISDYIPCKPNTTYTKSSDRAIYDCLACYDSSKTFIGRTDYNSDSITTAPNAAYIRLCSGIDVVNTLMFNEGSTALSFEPYSNICPISGQDSVTVSVDYGGGTVDDYELEFGETFYGGQARYTDGIVTSLWSYIASYNGETLPYLWLSDRDEYAIGTTPTVGAEVAYYGGPDAKTIHVNPINVEMTDETPISTDGKSISLTYQPKNTVLLEAKEYTDQELSPVNTRINGLDTRVQILENGGDRSLNYSTSEQVVGTWIDGKPLYQITKQWQVPAQVTGQWNNYSVGNLGALGYINISELAFDYSTSNYRFGNTVGLGTMEVASSFEKVGARLGYNTESGNVFVQLENVGTTSPLYQYGGTLTATIRYTKTTD